MSGEGAVVVTGISGNLGRVVAKLLHRTERVVGDVRDLGAGYVACDPRDASEIVLPIARAASPGPLLGVIDLDSHATHRFGQEDSDGLRLVLAAAGFAVPSK